MNIQIMTKEDLMEGIDIFPFTRTIWHNHKDVELWKKKYNMACPLHHRAEYLMVKQGHRKCATTHLRPQTFEKTLEKIYQDNLVWLPIQRTKSYNGFSHKHFPTDGNDPDSSVYGVLARNLEDAELFRSSSRNDEGTDHNTIGDLLGFPSCAGEFFNDIWLSGFFDPMWQQAVNTKNAELIDDRTVKVTGSIYNNQLLRYVGLRFNSHLPCSFNCDKSIETGKVWEEVGESLNKEAAGDLKDILRLDMEWSCLHGVAQIQTKYFTIITNSLPTKDRWVIKYEAID